MRPHANILPKVEVFLKSNVSLWPTTIDFRVRSSLLPCPSATRLRLRAWTRRSLAKYKTYISTLFAVHNPLRSHRRSSSTSPPNTTGYGLIPTGSLSLRSVCRR